LQNIRYHFQQTAFLIRNQNIKAQENPMKRECVSSGSPFEQSIAFSRAVRVGNIIAVSGTAPITEEGCPEGLYNQTKICLEIIKRSVEKAGGKLGDIVRTRFFLKNIKNWEEAAKAHGEYFAGIRPACSFIGVSSFIEEEWLVEIEADCVL
jgi:enamine deaminase RidA (YjgF/YER057c/UK114 family)